MFETDGWQSHACHRRQYIGHFLSDNSARSSRCVTEQHRLSLCTIESNTGVNKKQQHQQTKTQVPVGSFFTICFVPPQTQSRECDRLIDNQTLQVAIHKPIRVLHDPADIPGGHKQIHVLNFGFHAPVCAANDKASVWLWYFMSSRQPCRSAEPAHASVDDDGTGACADKCALAYMTKKHNHRVKTTNKTQTNCIEPNVEFKTEHKQQQLSAIVAAYRCGP